MGKQSFLVIGGAGFIGSHVAEYYLKKGNNVTIFDNFSRKGGSYNEERLKKHYEKNLSIVRGDIRTGQSLLSEEVSKHDVVFLFAAQVAVTTSVTNPRLDFDINALGTFNVLEAVRLSPNKPILLYSSTNKVYGGMEDVEVVEKESRYVYKDLPEGIPETRCIDFHSPYGCSKGTADQYVRDYSRIYGLRTVVFRQSCIYGTHQFGVEDQGWIAWFAIASTLGKPLTVYGNGKQVRDVLFIDDLVDLYNRAVQQIDVSSGKIYNVGGGVENTLSLLELLAILEELHGRKIPVSFSDWRPGDQKVCIMDISKAKKELGWLPKTSPRSGVKQLVDWITSSPELFSQ